MANVEKWLDRIYGETDFGRSIATTLAGVVGLVVYLVVGDWVVAAFSLIIAFPIIRILSSSLYEAVRSATALRTKRRRADRTYKNLSDEEQLVVKAFVDAGGAVLTWSQTNALNISSAAIESLLQRELLFTSMTADGMRETFVLDAEIFDAGNRVERRRRVA